MALGIGAWIMEERVKHIFKMLQVHSQAGAMLACLQSVPGLFTDRSQKYSPEKIFTPCLGYWPVIWLMIGW